MAEEQWRVVAYAPDYAVSDAGRLKRIRADSFGRHSGRIIVPKKGQYVRYQLTDLRGRRIVRSAHVLVCEAFNGPRPDKKMHCAHRDGSKDNNTPENLYWATPKENMADRKRHGREVTGDSHWTRRFPERVLRGERYPGNWARGERTACAKLTEEQVKEIIATPRFHGSGKMLSEKFGVSMGLIGHIRNGRAWTYLTGRGGKVTAPQRGASPGPEACGQKP